MDDSITPRLALPLLFAGQAQKELSHNEALIRLDLAVQAVVVAVGGDVPPVAPVAGACWIVGPAPVGDWAGQANALAGWTDAGWRFVAPSAGWRVHELSRGQDWRFLDTGWAPAGLSGTALTIDGRQVVGAQRPAIAAPEGGSMRDEEARTTIAAMLAALRAHGLVAID